MQSQECCACMQELAKKTDHKPSGHETSRAPVFPLKGGTRVLPPPPPPFLVWFSLMWSLECLISFDLMERPPLFTS